MPGGINYGEYIKNPRLVLKQGAELKLTRDEAENIFGSDFTGLQERDGFFVPDADALERMTRGSASPTGVASILSSTYGQRDDENVNRYDANGILTNINELGESTEAQLLSLMDTGLYSESEEGKKEGGELDELRRKLGVFSTDEEEQARFEGQRVLSEYAPLIAEAEQAKRQGLPKAIIGAGERGGFMSTQFAGGAALQPTEGGTFLGEGGELNRIKSVYDQNILSLRAQAKAAQIRAMSTARVAVRTGKREDYQLARESFEDAQRRSKEAIQVAQEKVNLVSQALGRQRENIAFGQSQQDRETEQIRQKQRDASDKMNYYIENFGVDYIEQNIDEITELFKEAGYENVDIQTIIKTMKEESARGKKPELRTIGDSLYSVYYDTESKEWKTKIILAGKGKTTNSDADTKRTSKDRFTQEEIMDPVVQQYADWVESGFDDHGNIFKINNVPTGTAKNPTRDKVIHTIKDRERAKEDIVKYFPESDKAKEPNETDKQVVQREISAIMGEDGYVDTVKYRRLRKYIADEAPNMLVWFDRTYHPNRFINPNDSTGRDLLTKSKPKEKGTSNPYR